MNIIRPAKGISSGKMTHSSRGVAAKRDSRVAAAATGRKLKVESDELHDDIVGDFLNVV